MAGVESDWEEEQLEGEGGGDRKPDDFVADPPDTPCGPPEDDK